MFFDHQKKIVKAKIKGILKPTYIFSYEYL